VILYEMLTGLRPIDARRLKKAALTEMIRIIREEDPSKPSTKLSTDEALPSMAALRQIEPRKLMALLRGELDWVVMKCLEKHRDRRYETASGLARDVQRYLADEAVEARPPSAGSRMSKFLKRNKGPVLAASFVLLALVAGFIGTAWGLFRADLARQAEATQRRIAVAEKTKAEASEALAKAQRSRAEQREEQAIDAVKRFRDTVANNPELKNSPALESLRKTLLKEPLAFFKALRNSLQADHDTRPESLNRLAQASMELGRLTDEIGDKPDALIAYREALTIRRKLAREHPEAPYLASDLGASLNNLATIDLDAKRFEEGRVRLREAVEWQRKALASNPASPTYRKVLAIHFTNLITAARELGEAEAKRELETLRNSDPRMVALDARLSAILHGDQAPKGQAERLRLAQRAYDKALHVAAARLWGEALATDPKLGDDRQAQHRYNAACAAALAGCGKGSDGPLPDDVARAKLRRQALDWLKAELVLWSKLVESGPPQAKPFIAQTLKH